MQLAYRHDERPGESYEALDGKKSRGTSPRAEVFTVTGEAIALCAANRIATAVDDFFFRALCNGRVDRTDMDPERSSTED